MSRKTPKPPALSKALAKRVTVISRAKRKPRDLKAGVNKQPARVANNPFATFSEWANDADNKAYANL